MARSVNRVTLVGMCGLDPKVSYLPNGNAFTTINLVTNGDWFDEKTGHKVEKTEWHLVSMYGEVAEIAGEYLQKGSQVYIEGKLHTRSWEEDGSMRYSIEVAVDMQGTMRPLSGEKRQDDSAAQSRSLQPAKQQSQPIPECQPAPEFNDFCEDIPFS